MNKMSDKELFCIFLKHSDVVINRYEELVKQSMPIQKNVNLRKEFKIVFEYIEQQVEEELRSLGAPDREGYRFPDYLFYLGEAGYTKYGIFSRRELYENVKWTIDVIDTYKDSIAWLLLFEYGDFYFSEEILRKYDRYIPWFNDAHGEKRYIPFTVDCKWGKSLGNFKNIGKLSYDFILSHISVIDLDALCETGEFEINDYLFRKLYNVMKEKDVAANMISEDGKSIYNSYVQQFLTNIQRNPRVSISRETIYDIIDTIGVNVFNWEGLLCKNELIEEDFFRIYSIKHNALEVLFDLDFEIRRKYVYLIESNKSLLELLGINFVKKMYQGGSLIRLYNTANLYSYGNKSKVSDIVLNKLPYTYDFSIDLIKTNIDLWNQDLYEYFEHMQRTPDTNYSYYNRVTTWDILFKQETILLTYDLCKYLMNINVKIGGYYVIEDVSYIGENVPGFYVNALSLFQFKSVLNKSELKKILADADLVNSLLSNAVFISDSSGENYWISRENKLGNHNIAPKGPGIVDYVVLDFFKDFSFDKFKELATRPS